MAAPDRDRRPPMAVAYELATQIMSVALMMALPAALGYWGDLRFNSSPWLLIAGAVFGLTGGMLQLLRGVGRGKKQAGDRIRNRDEASH